MKGKALELAALVLSILSTIVGSYYHDWIGFVLSIYSLIFSVFCYKKSNYRFAVFCISSAVLVLIGTTMVSVFLPFSKVDSGELDIYVWAMLSAISHALCLPTLAISSFYTIASVSNASYNFVMVGGFMTFIGIGMTMPGFILEYLDILYWTGELTTNAYALYTLLIALLVMIAASAITWRIMRRNRYLITAEGRKVRMK